MSMRLFLPLFILAACSTEPVWVLIEKKPAASTYVDSRGLRKESGLLLATTRTVTEPTDAKTPPYSSYTNMLVNCTERTVKFVDYEVVDDRRQVSIVKHGMANVFIPVTNWDVSQMRRFCEHVDNGRPLA